MAKRTRAKATTNPKRVRAKAKPAPGSVKGNNSKGNGDVRSDDEIRQGFLDHRTLIVTHQAKVDAAKKLLDECFAAAKIDGYGKKLFAIAADLAGSAKLEAKVAGEVTDRLKVARWIGHPMGSQLDLFAQPDRTPSVDRAYDAGKQASMENKPAKPTSAPDTEQYRSYMQGFHDHQRQLAGGITAPAAVRARGEDPATLAAGGDEL